MSAVLIFVAITLLQANFIALFNVDTKSAIVFKASDEQIGSGFGTSVAIQQIQQVQRKASVVIGAPKANITKSNASYGSVFNCDYFDDGESCKAITFQERTKGMHVAASVSSFGRRLIVCAPLWINKVGTSNPSGVCRLFDNHRQSRLSPFEDEMYQNRHKGYTVYYSNALFGFSAFLDKMLTVIGAPGFADFQGCIVTYKGSNYRNPIIYHHKHTNDEYMGYSVAVGRFFTSKSTQIVAGAPRCNFVGCIYIFEDFSKMDGSKDMEGDKNLVFSAFSPMTKQGEQLGESFGAALLTVDLNNDGFDDLIVGAPLHSPVMQERGDCGRIYVFVSDGEKLKKASTVQIETNIGARFGTALSSVGDLNSDGFNDIAVGAPYEDDGKGAVYIYHGTRTGLQNHYSQKISASDHLAAHNLQGFGISISPGIDVDNNSYRDLVIGAYNSEKAVLLRTKPSANMKLDILLTDPFSKPFSLINLDKPTCSLNNNSIVCFQISYCITLSAKYVTTIQKVAVKIVLDALKKRSFALIDSRKESEITGIAEVMPNNETCSTPIKVFIKNRNGGQMDRLTPLSIQLSADLLNDEKEESFCKDCLVLPEKAFAIEFANFEIGCGSDRSCVSDLHLNMSSSLSEIVHGFSSEAKELKITVNVFNNEENAFSSKVKLIVKPIVEIIKYESYCSFELNELNITITCDVGNPLESQKSFDITFGLKSIPSDSVQFTIDAEVSTSSHLTETSDIIKNMSLNIKRYSSIKLFSETMEHLAANVYEGQSRRNESHYKFTSKLSFKKFNDTFVEKAKFVFYLPSKLRKNVFLIKPNLVLRSENDIKMDCKPTAMNDSNVETTDTEIIESSEESSSYKALINQISKQYLDMIHLNCDTSECITQYCEIGPFHTDEQMVTIELDAAIDLSAIDELFDSDHSSILLTLKVQTDIIDTNIITQKQNALYPVLFRTVLHESSTIVVIASTCAGLFILVIVFILLFKYGFFEREKKKDLKQLKRRSAMINGIVTVDVKQMDGVTLREKHRN